MREGSDDIHPFCRTSCQGGLLSAATGTLNTSAKGEDILQYIWNNLDDVSGHQWGAVNSSEAITVQIVTIRG